jgi:hypothetical protein
VTAVRRKNQFRRTSWQFRVARLWLSWKQKPAPAAFLDYQTRTPLVLPFMGDWHVSWGGRTVGQNRHAVAPDQRFAYDFLKLEDGSFRDEGDKNELFLCFGAPIYAPAVGTVVDLADGVPDNKPGDMDKSRPPGNYVVLDHGNGEYSFLAHLKKGSLAVQPGQNVEAGTLLGLCGNSGNSSEPHLHFHLQDSSIMFRGNGLPAFFHHYRVRGKHVDKGEPIGRQFVSNK